MYLYTFSDIPWVKAIVVSTVSELKLLFFVRENRLSIGGFVIHSELLIFVRLFH